MTVNRFGTNSIVGPTGPTGPSGGPTGPQGPTGPALGSATINAQTATAYTLVTADIGRLVTLTNGSAITLTVPAGLGAGWNTTVMQGSTGQVSIAGATGVTVNNRYSHAKLSGNKAVASLVAYESDVYVLSGDTSA